MEAEAFADKTWFCFVTPVTSARASPHVWVSSWGAGTWTLDPDGLLWPHSELAASHQQSSAPALTVARGSAFERWVGSPVGEARQREQWPL